MGWLWSLVARAILVGLPSEAAVPSPTPSKRITWISKFSPLNLAICLSTGPKMGSVQGDTWHQSIEEASGTSTLSIRITPPTWIGLNP